MRTPEILAPAGSPETLSAALRAGADAVYLGGKLFSARSSAANFDNDQLREAARLCHMYGAKMYIAANTIISDGEADAFCEFIRFTSGIGVDGYIVQDPGCVYLIKKVCPDAVIHASTAIPNNSQPIKLACSASSCGSSHFRSAGSASCGFCRCAAR